ncbi:LPA1L [Auxenochlorella protothecoides x Auxenochlorella symbiontica]
MGPHGVAPSCMVHPCLMKADAASHPSHPRRPITDKEASLRVEVESPFRSLRIIVLGFCIASAGIGSLFSLVYILKDGPDAWKNLGINAGVVAVAAWLLRRDLKARGTAVNRVMREGQLGACEVQLQNGRRLRLADLRGSARVVIMVGTREQVDAAVGAAEPFRERLQAAGVLLVPAAIYDQGSGTSDAAAPQASAADLKWVAQPVRLAEWRTWFEQQTKSQGTPTAGGLYISLRLDGRIRASGRGSPPWEQLAAQLPSVSGFFGGFLDGMDGRV